MKAGSVRPAGNRAAAASAPRQIRSRKRAWSALAPALPAACLALSNGTSSAVDARGGQFVSFKSLAAFKSSSSSNGERVLLSPEIATRLPWTELIASWNLEPKRRASLKVEVRGIYADHKTDFYTMGIWSSSAQEPRRSIHEQKTSDGDVSTDTLVLRDACRRFEVRLTLDGPDSARAKIKFLGFCLTDSSRTPPPLEPNRKAWGKTIDVPERSQMTYPNGKVLCSPTTVSMLLAYWSDRLGRPELDHGVQQVTQEVFDQKWDGAGNWSFNTAFAGSMPGLRAYVTRFSDVSEIEDWIAAGIPVGLSVCYNKLRGRDGPPSGHLIVCVGFTPDGDVIANDPGTTLNVRKTFSRERLIEAWKNSKNAVYLIYPERARTPKDRFGHWDSTLSRAVQNNS